jgi:hypothetical protein
MKEEEIKKFRQLRKEFAFKKRRIILNNDGNECVYRKDENPAEVKKNAKTFLGKRSKKLLGKQVDSIFYCTGVFNLYSHQSIITEIEKYNSWSQELFENEGKDTLEIMSEFCKNNNIECFWSMRMNDTHDSSPTRKYLFAKWKSDNIECLMGKKRKKMPWSRFHYGKNRWSSVNYEKQKVRDQVFNIFQDVCTRYSEIDGIELDFFRHPVLFKPQMTGDSVRQDQRDLMTNLMERIRKMTEDIGQKRNKPLLISIRIPNSLGYLKEIGIDLISWLDKKLVDLIAIGGYFILEPWENFVELGKKYEIPIYAVLSGSRLVKSSSPEGEGVLSIWRNEAAKAWCSGIDGIYLFNRFDPNNPIMEELGSIQTIKEYEKDYDILPVDSMDGFIKKDWLKNGIKYMKLR